MAKIGQTTAAALLAYVYGGGAYAGAHLTDPTDVDATALANEISISGYARVSAAFASCTAPAGVTAAMWNTADLLFAAAAANWGAVAYVSLWTASSGGTLLWHGPLLDGGGSPTTITINSGSQFKLPANSLIVGLK